MPWLSFFSHIRQWFQSACYFFRKRVLLEDALKILFEQEEAGSQVSPRDLAQTLNVPERCVDRIVEALVERDLARRSGDRIVLTEEGRREALRVVRLHRLWEKYLAERTSLDPSEWHARA
ncbi:MAG TPA: iron dependent repressor, metal binding and dimerization domain protein, partial [Thermogutta sp.]|nr:iron dependent repressor, metal binding and dimerization domain protein [Thermogutta sp.]